MMIERKMSDNEEVRDTQWESALAGENSSETSLSDRLLGKVVRDTMLEAAEQLMPSEEISKRAWMRIEARARDRGFFNEKYRLLRWFSLDKFQVRVAFAMTTTFVFLGLIIIFQIRDQSDIVVLAMRGEAQIVIVSDANAEMPALVSEIRGLKLHPNIEKLDDGILVEIPWDPNKDTEAWLRQKGFKVSKDGKLRLFLKSSASK